MANTLPPVPRSKKKDWVVAAKIAVWLVSLAPIAILVDRIFLSGQYTGGDFVDDPVELIQHWTGTASLIFLLTTLAITPVRRLASFNKANRFRRLLGLFSFLYASLHVFSYFIFDQRMQLGPIAEDVIERNWILVGFLAWLLLIPLAVTSTTGWIRRMGGKRWNRLHKLIYPIGVLVVLHFLWQTKLLETEPLVYASTLLVLFGLRWWVRK
ncbi:MAG: sulfoxide reductase heme-binding subunit YedZ [Proteobacteria bacterium]|nr:sulfoxide reductase heme-binding subunit YedZ [Pseudomonadota bacterium]